MSKEMQKPSPELSGHCPACRQPMPCPSRAEEGAAKIGGEDVQCPSCGLTKHVDFWEKWDWICDKSIPSDHPSVSWIKGIDIEAEIKKIPQAELEELLKPAVKKCRPDTCHGQCQGMGACEDARKFREESLGLEGGRLLSALELHEEFSKE